MTPNHNLDLTQHLTTLCRETVKTKKGGRCNLQMYPKCLTCKLYVIYRCSLNPSHTHNSIQYKQNNSC